MSDNCPKMPDWIEFHNDVAAAHQSGYEEGAMDLAAMKERAEKAEAAEAEAVPQDSEESQTDARHEAA